MAGVKKRERGGEMGLCATLVAVISASFKLWRGPLPAPSARCRLTSAQHFGCDPHFPEDAEISHLNLLLIHLVNSSLTCLRTGRAYHVKMNVMD
jgi:hypothetical protein